MNKKKIVINRNRETATNKTVTFLLTLIIQFIMYQKDKYQIHCSETNNRNESMGVQKRLDQ